MHQLFFTSELRCSCDVKSLALVGSLAFCVCVASPVFAQTDEAPPPAADLQAPKLPYDPVAAAIDWASRPFSQPSPRPLPPAEVLDTVEYVMPGEGRSLYIQKIAPPPGYTPPPVPRPVPAPVASPSLAIASRDDAGERPEFRFLHFSATVHPVAEGTVATLVRWTHDGKVYQAWSSLDWNHFRGLHGFDSADGKKHYTLMLGVGNAGKWRGRVEAPVPPAFAPGEIAWRLLVGDVENKAAFADIETLHDLYRTDGHRLRLAFEIQEESSRARQEWLKANPPKPRDIIVRHWKVPTPKVEPVAESKEVAP